MVLPLPLRLLLLVQAVLVSIRCAEMRDGDRRAIVQLHNRIRNSVAMGNEGRWPPAADMLQMKYSHRLEDLARTHVSYCVFEPGCQGCHIGLDERPGQNLYAMAGPANWTRAINFWGQAPIQFDKRVPSEAHEPVRMKVSVLSQLLWSKTNKVGCAWKDCQSKLGTNIYVCNYMPAGNEMGGHVYQSGRPCSQCPKGTCCSHLCPNRNKAELTYEGLCAAEESPKH